MQQQAIDRSDFIMGRLEGYLPNVSDLVEISVLNGSTQYDKMINDIKYDLMLLSKDKYKKILKSERILIIDNRGRVAASFSSDFGSSTINNYNDYINGAIEINHKLSIPFISAFHGLRPVSGSEVFQSTSKLPPITTTTTTITGVSQTTTTNGYYVLNRIGSWKQPKAHIAYIKTSTVKV
jgi:hypothetical protein